MVAFHHWSSPGQKYRNGERFFFAIMCPEGPVANMAHSMATAFPDLLDRGYAFDVCTEVGNCHVDDARNHLVDKFLGTTCTHLIFIDADITFDVRALEELIACPEPLCGASYPYKDGSGEFPGSTNRMSYNDDRGYVPVEGLPTGFMKIHRSVFDRLKEITPYFFTKQAPGQEIHEFFRRSIDDRHVRVGGDIGFCHLWRSLDEQVWLIPKIELGHTGHRTETGSWWFKNRAEQHGVWPTVRDAILDGKWKSKQVLDKVWDQWGNPDFAGNNELLIAMMDTLECLPEGPVLELGSGLTTIWLSTTGRKIVTLEQDRAFLGKTWGVLDDFGPEFRDRVQFYCAPEENGTYQVPDEVWDRKYAFALVDGPVGTNENGGRRDMSRINADVILIDDAGRKGVMDELKLLEERGYVSKVLPVTKRVAVLAVRKKNGDSTEHSDEGAS